MELLLTQYLQMVLNIPAVVQLIAMGTFVLAGVYHIKHRVYLTYVLTNPATKERYIGRSSGFGEIEKIVRRRLYSHRYYKAGFTDVQVDKLAQGIDAKLAIRGREQQLIDYYGGIGNPKVANKIRAVAKINFTGRTFYKLSNRLFDKIYDYTGY